MSLPGWQERALSGIESALRKGEPLLASRFAIFTRLTRDEELPGTEQLMPRHWLQRAADACGAPFHRSRPAGSTRSGAPGRPMARLRALLLVPVMLLAMACALVAAGTASAHTCATPSRVPVAASRWATCTVTGAEVRGTRDTGTSSLGGPK